MSDVEKCQEWAYDRVSRKRHLCNRPVKRGGKCGIHALAAERRQTNFDTWLSKLREVEEMQRLVNAATVKYGYGPRVGNDLRVHMSATDLLGLIENIEDKKANK